MKLQQKKPHVLKKKQKLNNRDKYVVRYTTVAYTSKQKPSQRKVIYEL